MKNLKKLIPIVVLSFSLIVCSQIDPSAADRRRSNHPSISHPRPKSTPFPFNPAAPVATNTPTATPTGTATATPTGVSIAFTPDTTTVLRNHGVGLQSNLITETETYATATPAQNYPIPNVLYRFNWIDAEPTQGTRDFSSLTNFAYRARADNQLLNWRMYLHDPGSGIGEPSWVRTGSGLSGWQGNHDDGCSSTCAYSDWDDADNITAYTSTVQAMATAMANYPGPQVIDNGWGEYNENNHSGSHYTNGSATGIAPTPIGGAGNEIPTPLPTPKANFIQIFPTAFPNVPMVSFPDDQLTFDSAAARGHGFRADGWSYRNVVGNPTATPGACSSGGVQMCTLYRRTFAGNYDTLVPSGQATPTPIAAPTISQPNLWRTKTGILETWSVMSTWNSSSWPFAATLKWASDNHVSQLNTKNQFSPTYFEPNFGNLMKVIGYRHWLKTVMAPASVATNVAFTVNTTWQNDGVAPQTLGHKVLFKFCKQGGTGIYPDCYKMSTGTDALWLPGANTPIASSVTLPTWVGTGTYDLYVGLGRDNGAWLIPEERLAITSPAYTDGWYLTTSLSVTNGSPTTAPTTDYAGGFASASSQYLSVADSTALSFNGTNFQIGARVYMTSKSAIMVAVSKGQAASVAQEFAIWYDQSSDRLKFTVANGSTIYTATATNLGAPLVNTWYWVVGSFNNTTKAVSITVDNGTANTTTATGNVPNSSNQLRIGADPVGKYWNGRIDKVYGWKLIPSSSDNTAIYNSSKVLKVEDMTEQQRKGLYIALQNDEATGATRVDSWQATRYTDNNSVTQASSQ